MFAALFADGGDEPMKLCLNIIVITGFLLTLLLSPKSHADEACLPIGGNGAPVLKNIDAFTFILKRLPSCPKTVTELRTAFFGIGLTIQTAIVNQQGFDEGVEYPTPHQRSHRYKPILSRLV